MDRPFPVKTAADVAVREVTLLGAADIAYWADRLRPERLTPAEADGRAGVMLAAISSRFFGVRFRELSLSVLVRPPEVGDGRNAAFLVHAFNTSRFFAFCERVFFST